MPIKKARNHYLGKENCPRLNCAQAVLAGFDTPENIIDEFTLYGSGNAPDGWCGAAYATAYLLKNKAFVEKYFTEKAGSVKCQEIRANKKLSCIGCVEKSAELVKDYFF